MAWFTKKSVKWRRGIRDHADSRVEFGQLARTLGRPPAKKFLETVYDKWVNGHGYPLDDLAPATAALFMKSERESFVSRKQYVDSLASRTLSGELGTILRANLRPTTDYYRNPLRPGLTGRDLAIDQAANWVCGDYVAALPSTRALLEHYIPANSAHPGPAGAALGRSTQHLRAIFRRVVQNPAPYRLNLVGRVKYPSTIGGSLLLEHIIGLTAGTNVWPAFGDAHWESIAMFYLISIVHVQGFPDGNKRTGHLAYAVVLIKGTHSFNAPTSAKESELFRMNV